MVRGALQRSYMLRVAIGAYYSVLAIARWSSEIDITDYIVVGFANGASAQDGQVMGDCETRSL